MTLHTTDDRITGATPHQAVRLGPDRWTVSWMPADRQLTRNQAITAMMLAEQVARMVAADADHSHPGWALVNTWAAELGLSGPDAFVRCSEGGEDR